MSADAEAQFVRRAAEVKSDRAAKPAFASAAEVLEDTAEGAEREGSCACNSTLPQYRIMGRWIPERCAKCRGVGDDDVAAQTLAARATYRAATLVVPTKYQDANLANFRFHGEKIDREKQGRVHQLALRYVAQWPQVPDVVVFRGGTGSGKGHMTYAIAKQLVHARGATVLIEKLAEIVRILRETWHSRDGETERQRLTRYRECDLLVIDEVSRHAFYGNPTQHLYDLVAYREEWCRPTLMTSNETPAVLVDILGPALTSRTAGSSGLWDFGDADYRLFARKERDAA